MSKFKLTSMSLYNTFLYTLNKKKTKNVRVKTQRDRTKKNESKNE